MVCVYRKEIKYVIPREIFGRLQRLLDVVLERDSHCRTDTYTVRSQYYDSLSDTDLRDNLSGVQEKRKIRVRIYSPEDRNAKLEYKCKNGSDGIKYSLPISREEALCMQESDYDFLMERMEPLAPRLYAKMTQQVYFPKTIVEYDRMAYVYPASDVRITYDSNLRATGNQYGLYDKEVGFVPLMDPAQGVLEVKYNDFFPAALKPLITDVNSVAEACSKYSRSRLMNL